MLAMNSKYGGEPVLVVTAQTEAEKLFLNELCDNGAQVLLNSMKLSDDPFPTYQIIREL